MRFELDQGYFYYYVFKACISKKSRVKTVIAVLSRQRHAITSENSHRSMLMHSWFKFQHVTPIRYKISN